MATPQQVMKQMKGYVNTVFELETEKVAEEKRVKVEELAEATTENLFQRMVRYIGGDETPPEVRYSGTGWQSLTPRWIDQKARHWRRYRNGPPMVGEGKAFYWGISPKSSSLREYLANKKAHANFGVPKSTVHKKSTGVYEIRTDLYPRVRDLPSDEVYSHLRGRQAMVDRLQGLAVKRPFLKPFMVYLLYVEFKEKAAKL